MKIYTILILITVLITSASATDYHVGPGQTYANINAVPWESMNAGDHVFIYYRTAGQGGPYNEKWVVNVQGTSVQPFTITGVAGPGGELPVIDGNGATTRTQLSYWNEERSVIKVGGSSIPSDGMPSYIVIENLEIKSGHNDYTFTDDNGNTQTYSLNAASIHVEKVDHLTIKNCKIHDSGNGIFIASNSNDINIEGNYIFGNGNVGRFFEHNTYTEASGITYQYNRFGPLKTGADGNNLKDRSAGLVVRYNWIEGGNRLMDLVDSGNSGILADPDYLKTFVYGNILIEEDGGNSQVIHYGGDSGTTSNYRKGKLYFYNNTLYSIRAGNTTLARLSTNDETGDFRNNILFVTAQGSKLALLDAAGIVTIHNNLMKSGWINSHQGGGFTGTVTDDGSSVLTDDPGFMDGPNYDFSLMDGSPAANAGTTLHPDAAGIHDVNMEYVIHQSGQVRPVSGTMDIGGYENDAALPLDLIDPFETRLIDGKVIMTWSTQNEVNVNGFVISKKVNGQEAVVLKKIDAKGGHNKTSYTETDADPGKGSIVYMLSEENQDGQQLYLGSSIILMPSYQVSIYPNPAQQLLYIDSHYYEGLKNYQILDLSGKVIQKGKVKHKQIFINHLRSGNYILLLDGYKAFQFIKS